MVDYETNHEAGERLVKVVDDVEYTFCWCPPGKFLMGSSKNEKDRYADEGPQHEVTLTKGFWMLETQVTQKMWQSVMGNTPSYFKGDNLPVEQVSWDDCQEFCLKLSSKIGMNITLPTEAQWEYACRAGTTTPFHFGSTLNGDNANCDGRYPYGTTKKGPCTTKKGPYLKKTAPVKNYSSQDSSQDSPKDSSNAWGLCDMHGNVWEWCQDWYDKNYYEDSPSIDPTGPESGSERVLRGGSWDNIAKNCRSAVRGWSSADKRSDSLGFRLVGSSK